MDLFGTAHVEGRSKKVPLPSPHLKICNTYPIMMKLGTVIPYLRKIQKMYESRDTPLEFFHLTSAFSPQLFSPKFRNRKLLYQEIQI